MIKIVVLLSGLCLTGNFLSLAQSSQLYEVKAGEIFKQVMPLKERYGYETFQEGEVSFTDGKSTKGRFNYNYFYDTMEFISAKGDTLLLADTHRIHKLAIGQDLYMYYYKQGYFQQIAKFAQIKLARKRQLLLKEIISKKPYPNGYEHSGSPIAGISLLNPQTAYAINYNRVYDHPCQEDLLFTKETSFYLIDKNQRIYPATKPTLLKLYPKNRKKINHYLQTNSINFKKEEDLLKLLSYCSLSDTL
jgi:hypothetical protein